MYTNLIIHYNEIGLKGKNRSFFEEQLIRNIQFAISKEYVESVRRISGRILVTLKKQAKIDTHEIENSLLKVYGISWFLFVKECRQEKEAIRDTVVSIAKEIPFSSFAVRAKRDSKRITISAQELNAYVGAAINEAVNKPVNLEEPELIFYIEMVEKYCFIGFERVDGNGGLPVGVSGKIMLLLSGGIDSPVAGSLLQKRGCELECVHFHNSPYTSDSSIDKVKELAKILAKYQRGKIIVHFVPFTELQKDIVKKCEQQFRVILYRRFMMRVAEVIASKNNIHALATGDSIGQVASQTVENLEVVSNSSKLPIFRPLIGFDKIEIISRSKQIETYNISILPHEDCCSYFMPRQPATHSTISEIEKQESMLNIDELIKTSIENTEIFIL